MLFCWELSCHMRYWPSVRSRWLNYGGKSFIAFLWSETNTVEDNKNAKKNKANIQASRSNKLGQKRICKIQPQESPNSVSLPLSSPSSKRIGSLGNDDGDGNENGKKNQLVYTSKTTTLHVAVADVVHSKLQSPFKLRQNRSFSLSQTYFRSPHPHIPPPPPPKKKHMHKIRYCYFGPVGELNQRPLAP